MTGLPVTDDEIVVLVEALREYRLRLPESGRRVVVDALIFRLGHQLVENAKQQFLESEGNRSNGSL